MKQLYQAPPHAPYHRFLAGESYQPMRSILGVVLALLSFSLVSALVAQLVLGIAWSIQGRPSSFGDYWRSALAFERPSGVLAAHLGLGALILLAWVLVRWVHLVEPRWIPSVQPGVRWRYLLLTLLVALVVLGTVLGLSLVLEPKAFRPQADWPVFLAIILLTAPLQAAAEEVFFRGYLFAAIGSLIPQRWAVIGVTALVFTLFHGVQNPALFASRFAFGIIAGMLVSYTGGLEAPIAAHIVNNLLAFGLAMATSSVAEVRAITEIDGLTVFIDVAGFAVFGLVALWLGRRMNLATLSPG